MSHFVDTSVLTGYYCPEERSELAQSVLRPISSPAISPLVEVELHCAVARKVRAGAIARSFAQVILVEFRLHLAESRYRVVGIEAEHYVMAREWIAEMTTPLRVLDALHLAVARTNDLTLLTADKTLAASARYFGIGCKLVA